MEVLKSPISGLSIIQPSIFRDERGFFLENFNSRTFSENFPDISFVQDNFSKSSKGVIRGLHYQQKFSQGKLVQVTLGSVYDVAVDLRKGSKSFGSWYGIILDDQNLKQFWIPPGFAHGFQVLSEVAHFQYKCTEYYHPEYEETLLWNDKSLNIQWHEMDHIISSKDKAGLQLSDVLPIEN